MDEVMMAFTDKANIIIRGNSNGHVGKKNQGVQRKNEGGGLEREMKPRKNFGIC